MKPTDPISFLFHIFREKYPTIPLTIRWVRGLRGARDMVAGWRYCEESARYELIADIDVSARDVCLAIESQLHAIAKHFDPAYTEEGLSDHIAARGEGHGGDFVLDPHPCNCSCKSL